MGEIRTDLEPYQTYLVYEKYHFSTHEIWGGYVRHNQIHREIYDSDGNLINDEYLFENHALMMYEPLIGAKEVKEEIEDIERIGGSNFPEEVKFEEIVN